MRVVGKILWWDQKDKNGIIVDANNNEFYFDISVVDGRKSSGLKSGTLVRFQIESSSKIACAKFVSVPLSKDKNQLEREFQKNLQLAFAI